MRKIRFLIIFSLTTLFILLLSLSGCGSSTPTSSGNQTAIAGLSGSTMSAQSTSKKEEKKKEKKDKEDKDSENEGAIAGNTGAGGTGNASGTVVAAVVAPPIGVTATAVSATQININWSPASGAVSYNIYRSVTATVTVSAANKINVTPVLAGPFGNTGLTPATTYYYVITSVSANGTESAASAVTSATTLGLPPTAPVGVVATASIGQNTINWVAVPGATSYNIYWSTAPGVNQTTGTKIAGVTTTSYTQTGLTAGTTYYYIITAVNANGESIASAQVSGIPLAPPPVIVARNVAYVVNSADNNVSVIDLKTYATIKTIPVGISPSYITVNPNTNKAYVTNYGDNTVSIIDTKTDTVVGAITGVTTPMDIKVNPQTNRLYVTSNYNPYLTVIDANANTVIASVLCGQWTRGVTLDTQANKAYIANTVTNDVSVVDMNTNTVIATLPLGVNPQPHGIDIDIAAKRIYTVDHVMSTVSVVDINTNTTIATIPTGSYPQGIFVNPVLHRAYVGNTWTAGLGVVATADTVTVIDTLTNQVVTTVSVGVGPASLQFGYNPATNFVYVTNSGSNNVSVIDPNTNTVVATFPVGKAPLGVAIIP